MLSVRVRTMNDIAIHVVALASLASHVFAWFFERNVSAAPEMAPERPERLPDCNRTTAISTRQDATWITVNTGFNSYTSNDKYILVKKS